MLYSGLTILGLTENQFWEMTPRKFFALLQVHNELRDMGASGAKGQNAMTTIDQIQGW